ncbi:MAG: dTMP kinase [Phycisphaerales bacterium]
MSSYTPSSVVGASHEPEETGFAAAPPDLLTEITGAGPVDISGYPGRLICLEGTDGVGRSTHIALLREWLEMHGYGVAHSAIKTSQLAGEGLARAQEGHTLGRRTMDLFYATDFADRLERNILPALKAGFVVLTDRYIYAMIARSIVRGSESAWIEDVYRFAPEPHAVFYLDVDVEHLTPRVVASGGFDYWESGMDFQEGEDVHASFVRYQGRLLRAFSDLSERHGFITVNARRPVEEVFAEIRSKVQEVVGQMEGARA